MPHLPKLRILSAGAPKTGVRLCAETNFLKAGDPFEIEFVTAPVIRERLVSGSANADVIVAPSPMLEEATFKGAIIDGSVVALGTVTAGVAVRNGAHEPDINSVEAFRQALLDADLLIYNRASSGQYIEHMIGRLGIAQSVAGKTMRTNTGAEVMECLARDHSERAIGFGQVTEISLKESLGVHLVGPLPGALGKKTNYGAGLTTAATNSEEGLRLLELIASEEGRHILLEAGLE